MNDAASRDARPSIIVLGIGNTLMQDDGIGVWAVRGLAERYEIPTHVQLIEGGIAGLRLLPYFSGVGHLLIIDAVRGSGPPGTVYHLDPSDLPKGRRPFMSAHEVGILETLSAAELLGSCPQTRILGVQPNETDSVGLELTPPLQKALPRVMAAAAEMLRGLGAEITEKAYGSQSIDGALAVNHERMR
jgi:hydrogenase maturation protease